MTKKLYRQLSKIIAQSNSDTSGALTESLLSDAEHLMLAKRLAIILMLHQGYPKRTIAPLLQVSRTTVRRMDDAYKQGALDGVLRTIGKKSRREKEETIKTINAILRLGMPSMGRDRWEWLDKQPGMPRFRKGSRY